MGGNLSHPRTTRNNLAPKIVFNSQQADYKELTSVSQFDASLVGTQIHSNHPHEQATDTSIKGGHHSSFLSSTQKAREIDDSVEHTRANVLVSQTTQETSKIGAGKSQNPGPSKAIDNSVFGGEVSNIGEDAVSPRQNFPINEGLEQDDSIINGD